MCRRWKLQHTLTNKLELPICGQGLFFRFSPTLCFIVFLALFLVRFGVFYLAPRFVAFSASLFRQNFRYIAEWYRSFCEIKASRMSARKGCERTSRRLAKMPAKMCAECAIVVESTATSQSEHGAAHFGTRRSPTRTNGNFTLCFAFLFTLSLAGSCSLPPKSRNNLI